MSDLTGDAKQDELIRDVVGLRSTLSATQVLLNEARAERDRFRVALRELYAGMMEDAMPGTELVEWHVRHPWAREALNGGGE